MFKFIYLDVNLFFHIIALHILPCLSHTCIQDKVASSKVHVSLTRSIKNEGFLTEQEMNPNLFEPLRIYFYIDIVQRSISLDTIHNVELALEDIKSYIESTFQVRKRKRPFVLDRESCSQRWQTGRNAGKCSRYNGEPEMCESIGILYQVPFRFLDKLEVYDLHNPEPHFISSAGVGLTDSNFIVFILAEDSGLCEEQDVSAYGSYCKVNQSTNEPLAGIINLCPSYFIKKIYPSDHYYNILLHELFHVLGFSSSLFEKFQPCEEGVNCDVPKHLVQEDAGGIPRMMFPLVVESAQNHFNCSKSDFGAPMNILDSENNASNLYPSHWHPVLMFSSIMSPMISEYDNLYVDNMTLAVFASTGWYRINFENVDNYLFGKNEGCDFGVNSSCENNKYICDPSQNNTGCDFENKVVAKCTSLVSYHPCGVYKPYPSDECGSHVDKQFLLDFYSLGLKEGCFVFNKSESVESHCLPIKCRSERAFSVMINMTWLDCPSNESIMVDDVQIHCPHPSSFCVGASEDEHAAPCLLGTAYFISVRVYFKSPTFQTLSDHKNFKNFKVATIRAIADGVGIPLNYIVNSTLSFFKKIYLDFHVCPPINISKSEQGIFKRLQKFLDSGNFLHILKGFDDVVISSSDIKIERSDAISFSDWEGFRILIVLPIIFAIVLISVFIASLIKIIPVQRQEQNRRIAEESRISLSRSSSHISHHSFIDQIRM